jgi:ribulose-phosphate 3-epimerase
MATIYPSLISADLLNLEQTIKKLDPYCAGYHLDIMDNHFVPNLTWGPAFINAINAITTKQMWVHLMVDNPESIIRSLILKPKSIISFHIETKYKITNIIDLIKEKNWLPSIAINPKTDIAQTFSFLPGISQVLIMSVEPGFSGQALIPFTMDKVVALIDYRKQHGLSFSTAMDGGIAIENIAHLTQLGVDQFAVASTIFKASDPVVVLKELNAFTKK